MFVLIVEAINGLTSTVKSVCERERERLVGGGFTCGFKVEAIRRKGMKVTQLLRET